jgi:hypothetical protein
MFVPFQEISAASRIWIYQSDRKLTAHENAIIANDLKLFTEQWDAHGRPVKASFDIQYDRFIIIAADETFNATSGCSIDASVKTIKEVEQRIDIQLFDRSKIAFKNNDQISVYPLSELKDKYLQGHWSESTLMFNNLIKLKGQLENEWLTPAGNTWLKRYVPDIKVAP